MRSLKILLLISSFLFLLGCGARKVDMHKTYEKEQTSTSVKETKKNDIEEKATVKKQETNDSKTNTESGTTQNTVEKEFSITVEPTKENPTGVYDININGKKFTGTTNAKITITNKKKKDSIKTNVKIDEVKSGKKESDSTGLKKDLSKSDLKIDTESDKVKKDKNKTTDKKESWVFNILGILAAIGVIVALYFIVKTYIKKIPFTGK